MNHAVMVIKDELKKLAARAEQERNEEWEPDVYEPNSCYAAGIEEAISAIRSRMLREGL